MMTLCRSEQQQTMGLRAQGWFILQCFVARRDIFPPAFLLFFFFDQKDRVWALSATSYTADGRSVLSLLRPCGRGYGPRSSSSGHLPMDDQACLPRRQGQPVKDPLASFGCRGSGRFRLLRTRKTPARYCWTPASTSPPRPQRRRRNTTYYTTCSVYGGPAPGPAPLVVCPAVPHPVHNDTAYTCPSQCTTREYVAYCRGISTTRRLVRRTGRDARALRSHCSRRKRRRLSHTTTASDRCDVEMRGALWRWRGFCFCLFQRRGLPRRMTSYKPANKIKSKNPAIRPVHHVVSGTQDVVRRIAYSTMYCRAPPAGMQPHRSGAAQSVT